MAKKVIKKRNIMSSITSQEKEYIVSEIEDVLDKLHSEALTNQAYDQVLGFSYELRYAKERLEKLQRDLEDKDC
jgi:hypothetical protein